MRSITARRRYDLLGLEHIMRTRLFDIHVLARLARPNRLKRVIVVGGSNGNSVDIFVFQKLAQIRKAGGTFLASLFVLAQSLIQDILVDIAESNDFDVVQLAVALDVIDAPTPDADTGDPHLIVQTEVRRGAAVAATAELIRKCLRFTTSTP